MGRQIGNVEGAENFFGGARIVVRRPANEREAGERHERINRRPAVFHEELFDGRARVKPAGEGWNHAKAARFQGCNSAVVMRRVAGQKIRAHDDDADGSARAA